MLRAILATLGVALIAFGLFGGKSLERVYAGLNGVADKFGAGGSAQELIADSTSIDSSDPQSDLQVDPQADTRAETTNPGVTEALVDQIDEPDNQNAESVTIADSPTAVGSVVTETASDVASSVAASDGSDNQGKATEADATVSTQSSADGSAGGNADNGGAMQEVRASARNKELELALGTGENENAEVQKEAAVGEIVQTTAGGSSVEALFVLKDLVNMRQGPSIEHPVVLRLEKGQELMEFKRDGKWVHVGAYGTSGKIGWVHERLVGKTPG